eukprot:SAG31_NODE_24631_length_477_cov_1.224868_2_plen_34_part_01
MAYAPPYMLLHTKFSMHVSRGHACTRFYSNLDLR